ncbi:interferon-inducible GTPase 1-like [Mya arenaria]|uniref:interferon-inducible GTPase 1-like n=1 Tax=Mya arenaria TaxID=6604 RepID=UPI0022E945E9|nr:interferon-inducible GTPase 1-like [Mya arenaria]
MQPELHTETKNETPDDDNDKMAKLFGDTRNMVGLNKYMTTLREKGPTTLNRKLEYDLDKWRYFEVKIAVVGSSGSGKSSLINAVLDLKTRQEEMADVGVIEKTTTVISYRNKDRPNLVFYDFPGVGTNYPKHTYFDYDFFLIVSKDKLSENDLLFAREIQKREKKFYFVRTHIDATLRNDKRSKPKTHNENMVKEDVKNAIFKTLSREAITKDDCHIFLLDNYEKEKFDFKRLLKTLIMNTPDYKRQTLTLSLAADVEETINEKVEVLKARIYTVALHASLGSGELRPFFESDTNEAVLYKEGNLYREQLGIDDKSLKKTSEVMSIDMETLEANLHLQTHMILISMEEFINWMSVRLSSEATEDIANYTLPDVEGITLFSPNFQRYMITLNELLTMCETETRRLHNELAKFVLK